MTNPITGEPTYDDEDGVTRPGSQDLTDVVTVSLARSAESLWKEHFKNNEHRNNYSGQNPHIAEPFSPLETLIEDAFQRFGNMSVDTLDGSIKRMLLRFANRIVEDIRIHPYGSTPDLDYYINLQDTRPIPDEIVLSGLAYHYSKWQSSTRTATFYTEYTQIMNQILYQRKFGSGKIQMNTVDKTSTTQES